MQFSQISGQDRAKKMLLGAVINKRVANAYLFLGPFSSGTREAAGSFAAALNCSSFKEDSCGVCKSCLKIDKGVHPDIFVLKPDGATIKIDQIRDLISYTRFGPAEDGFKVCVIDDARALTTEAANSFLKTLEEPLPGVVFILLSESEVGIPQTILSRCQKVIFSEASTGTSDRDSEIASQVEWIFSELRSVKEGDVAKLLEISSKIDGDRLEEKLDVLSGSFWRRDAASLEAAKTVISTLSAVKKRANKKLALDVMFLKLGESIYVK